MSPLISLSHVNKLFGSGRTAVRAVQDISLDIVPGGVVLIMGPSGSGKTTLLSIAGTLMKPSQGNVLVQGKSIINFSNKKLAHLRLNYFGFIFQTFNLFSALTAEENVMMPLLIAGISKSDARAKAQQLLKKLQLEKRMRHVPKNLSGGEKQRVAIARALANNPKVILADEPTANLDSKIGHEIVKLLCEIACQESRGVIIVSHDQRLQDVAKIIYTIEDGAIVGKKVGGHDAYCTMKHPG